MKNIKLILTLFLFTQLIFAQDRKASGVVIDSVGEVVVGVTVIVKGTGRGTSTNINGEYSIKATHNDTLVFSFLGMKTQIISALTPEINVRLLSVNYKEVISYGPEPTRIKKINHGYICKLKANPKYNFKYNSLRNNFIIYVNLEKTKDSLDLSFEKKYNIVYVPPGNFTKRYYKKHNKLTFKYLNTRYKEAWQSEIRKDTF